MHDSAYVAALRTGGDRQLAESQGLQWCPGIWPMAVHTTAGLIAATNVALTDGIAGSLSSGLHHAKPGRGDGYCTVNGLVIAAHRLVADHKRVVILDLDAHCGGGTAAMIRTYGLTESVRTFDLSTNTFDHYQPALSGDHLVVVGHQDDDYIDAVGHMLDEIDWAGTDIVLYNAGVDPHPGISRLAITMEELVDVHWETIDSALSAAST